MLTSLLFEALRILAGSAVLLIVPGASIGYAIYPYRGSLSLLDRLAISVGLSIACSSALAVILGATSWGIQPQSLIVLVGLCGAMGLLVGWLRRRSRRSHSDGADRPPAGLRQALSPWMALPVVVGSSLLLAFGIATAHGTREDLATEATQFYLVPFNSDGGEGSFQEPHTVVLGIVCRETSQTSFSVLILQEGTNRAELTEDILLDPGEEWSGTYKVAPPTDGQVHRLTAALLKGKEMSYYRILHLWLSTEESMD